MVGENNEFSEHITEKLEEFLVNFNSQLNNNNKNSLMLIIQL